MECQIIHNYLLFPPHGLRGEMLLLKLINAEFVVRDPTHPSQGAQAVHFAKKGQARLQLVQTAGVDRLGQDRVHKPTNLAEGVVCGTRISIDRGCTCR